MDIDSFINNFHFNVVSLLEELPAQDRMALKACMVEMKEDKDKVLFKENTYSKGIYILKKGIVKIYQARKDGGNQIVYFYGPGELMGYRPLFSTGLHPVTAETLEDSEMFFIPEKEFLDVLYRSPVLSKMILTNLSQEFMVLVNTISVFTQQTIIENAALALLILDEKYSRKNAVANSSEINISRKDFANYIGTTIETSVRALRKFKNDKIISTHGRGITILNREKLAGVIWDK